jgi:hypothetical protein
MKTWLLILLGILCCLHTTARDEHETQREKLVREARDQLHRIQQQNESNKRRGRSAENNYILVIGDDYPDAAYIKQRHGLGRGANVPYVLDRAMLTSLNNSLQAQNQASEIDTYVLIIKYVPLEFNNELPDDQSIADFFSGIKIDVVEKTAAAVQKNARDLVNVVTNPLLQHFQKPTLFCGLVNFRVFKNGARGISQWVYYPNHTRIEFDEQYKNLLNGFIRNGEWPRDEASKVIQLIRLIEKNNREYARIKNSFAKITSIIDADDMIALVRTLGNVGMASLTVEQRLWALKVLTTSRLTNGREIQVLNLLKTAPVADFKAMLQGLTNNNELATPIRALISCIVDRTEDKILLWGDDNYLELIKTITAMILHGSSDREQKLEALANDVGTRYFIWDKSYALNLLAIPPVGTHAYQVTLQDDGMISIERKYVSAWNCEERVEGMAARVVKRCEEQWSTEPTLKLSPFDLVAFVNRSDLGMLQQLGGSNGQMIVVPALLLQYAQDKKINSNVAAGFFLTLDVVTLAIPFTKVYNLATVVGRIYLTLDLTAAAGAAGNISVNMLNDNSAFSQVVAKYNAIMGIVNIAALAGGTRLTASLAGDFVTEVNQPGIRSGLEELAKTGNKQAGKVLALETELKLQGKISGQAWAEEVEIVAKGADEVNDITTALLHSGEDFTVLTNARKLPGTATGNGKNISGTWLRGTDRNAGLFPKSVADKLKGKEFKNFDEFRQAFWKEVANDPHLASQFELQQVERMREGQAPFVKTTQRLGEQRNYILHHKTPINQGGGVYDMDNLYIVTPRYHKEILDPAYHYGYGY